MKKLLFGLCSLALVTSLATACTESRTDRLGERPGARTPPPSPTTPPPASSTAPSSPTTPTPAPAEKPAQK